jgi:hypothetical protein
MTVAKPAKIEYDPYYENYISQVTETDLIGVLDGQTDEINELFGSIPEDRGTFAYAEGKWTIKELLSHVIDAERMFAYRVLRIARGDKTPIEGFEQDGYIENSHANTRTFADLTGEFAELRAANLRFFRNLNEEDWLRTGTANKMEISVRALAFIMAGHIRHHIAILNDRYLA